MAAAPLFENKAELKGALTVEDEQLSGPATIRTTERILFVPSVDLPEPDFLEEEMEVLRGHAVEQAAIGTAQ